MRPCHWLDSRRLSKSRNCCPWTRKILGLDVRVLRIYGQKILAEQKLFLALPSFLSTVVPMILSLLVDRCLGFERSVSSDSFVYAGKSYNMKCFCESIYVDLISGADGPRHGINNNGGEEIVY